MKSQLNLVLMLLLAALVLAGCSDDDDSVVVPPGVDPGPESPQELVEYFLVAYENRDVAAYLALLDPDYLMLLTLETSQDFPGVGTTLDYAEEERIHSRMFSGDALADPEGDLVPGVEGISFAVFNPMGAWAPTDDPQNFPDSVWMPYQVVILFDRGQSFSTLRPDGLVKFYARGHEVVVDGVTETHYLLAGVKDLTGLVKGTENVAWGSVKALYR